MTVLAMLACMVVLWRLFTPRSGSVIIAYLERLTPTKLLARVAAATLAPLYAAGLALDVLRCRLETVPPRLAWMNALPLPVYDGWNRGLALAVSPYHAQLTALGLGIGTLETLALGIVVLGLRHQAGHLGDRFVVTLAAALAALSLLAPAMSTTDPYEYAATGLLGLHAYAPPVGAFIGTAYESVQKHIALTGVIYGPLWVLIDTAQTAFGSSIYAKIELLRVTNIGFVALTLWLLARGGIARPALVAFTLNPAIWYYSVANPHADIEAIALLAAVSLFARRSRPVLAAVFLVAAGLVKLPFVIVGGALLAPLAAGKQRWYAYCAALAAVLVVSSIVSGPAYFMGVSHYAAGASASASALKGWLAIAPLAVLLTLLLVARGRQYFGAAWLFHEMLPLAAPWYLYLGFPYAIATTSLDIYLVCFPLAATQTATSTFSIELLALGLIILTLDVCASKYRQDLLALEPASASLESGRR